MKISLKAFLITLITFLVTVLVFQIIMGKIFTHDIEIPLNKLVTVTEQQINKHSTIIAEIKNNNEDVLNDIKQLRDTSASGMTDLLYYMYIRTAYENPNYSESFKDKIKETFYQKEPQGLKNEADLLNSVLKNKKHIFTLIQYRFDNFQKINYQNFKEKIDNIKNEIEDIFKNGPKFSIAKPDVDID